MVTFKFKIGDKVKYIRDKPGYKFSHNGIRRELIKGDVVTISSFVEFTPDIYNGNAVPTYGFVEDENSGGAPNWMGVEQNFGLAPINWKIRLEDNNGKI